jgi:hypothetical protein
MADEHQAESPNAEGRDDGDVAKGGAKGDEDERDDKRKSGMDPRKRRRFILRAAGCRGRSYALCR